jgi:hypothetical protein
LTVALGAQAQLYRLVSHGLAESRSARVATQDLGAIARVERPSLTCAAYRLPSQQRRLVTALRQRIADSRALHE